MILAGAGRDWQHFPPVTFRTVVLYPCLCCSFNTEQSLSKDINCHLMLANRSRHLARGPEGRFKTVNSCLYLF